MGEVEKGIEPDQKVQVVRGAILVLERSDRVDRIGFSGPPEFNVRQTKRWRVGGGKADHFVSVVGGGQRPILLVGRMTGRNEDHPVEAEFVTDQSGNGKMAVVNGIETAAKQAQLEY